MEMLLISEPGLESLVKVEAERFEDENVKEQPPRILNMFEECQLNQIAKCYIHVYDFKPLVKLHRLDAETILKCTKMKTETKRINDNAEPKRRKFPETQTGFSGARFNCDLCPNWFPAKSSLKKHMYCHRRSSKHASNFSKQSDDTKPCPFCFKKVEADKLRKHINNHKQLLNKRKCPTCGLKITNTHLKRHMLSHEQFRCRICKLVLKSQNERKEHISKVHYGGKGHECFCGKIYGKLIDLRCHQNGVHSDRKYSCEVCGQECENYVQKLTHWKVEHFKIYGNHRQWKRQNGNITMALKTGGPYICDICGKKVEARNYFSQHLKLYHGPKKIFSCDVCGKFYNFKSALSMHMRSLHVHMETAFECDICGKKFKLKGYLRQHVGTHNKKTKCRICHKFVTNMKSHIGSVHIYAKKEACSICGVVISNRSMEHHINAQHVEKPMPYKCDDCGEAFRHKIKFIEHKTEKHGFKPLRCHCGYSNACSLKFKNHQKLHIGRPSTYPCPVCGMKSTTVSNLRRHWKARHKKSLGHRKFHCTMNRKPTDLSN